jgi:hypothetical protein
MQNALPDSAGKRYVARPSVIEAVQLDGDNSRDAYLWIERHIGSIEPSANTTGVTIDPADGVMVIRDEKGDQRAPLGHWIVKEADGEFWVCPDDNFLKTYAPDDGSGILVIPPGLMNNIDSAGYDVKEIRSKQTSVTTDWRQDPFTLREQLVTRVEHIVDITAERKRG